MKLGQDEFITAILSSRRYWHTGIIHCFSCLILGLFVFCLLFSVKACASNATITVQFNTVCSQTSSKNILRCALVIPKTTAKRSTQRARERERERETDRQTDRQTDSETEKERERQRQRQIDRDGDSHRETNRRRDRDRKV